VNLKSPYSEWKYGQNNDTEYFKFTKLKGIFALWTHTKRCKIYLATYTNSQLQEMTAENYYTIASWRFKFNCNQLSMEKQISILTKLNYQPTQNLLWKKQAK
jgi:hypothetical protein